MLLGYTDLELANKGGYDLVHYDDLAYVASAHQERKCTNAFTSPSWNYMRVYFYSAEDWCIWDDRISSSNPRRNLAMATNLLQARVQKLKTRFHHMYSSPFNVSNIVFQKHTVT